MDEVTTVRISMEIPFQESPDLAQILDLFLDNSLLLVSDLQEIADLDARKANDSIESTLTVKIVSRDKLGSN